jgi:phage protein D
MPTASGLGSAIAASRPTIVVAGQERAALTDGLLSLSVHETISGLYRCEATFGNWGNVGTSVDYLYFDRRTLEFGSTFAVRIGQARIFSGRIHALEAHFREGGPREITVLAEDRFQDLRMTRRTRTFNDMSDADVIRQIAQDHQLTPSVSVSGPTYKVLAQVNQSDLAFVRERARTVDGELWLDDSTLNAKPRSSRGAATVTLTYQQELHEFSALSDLAGQRTSVTVSGWDVDSKSVITHEADEAAIRGELNNDLGGAGILMSVTGQKARKETVVHTVPLSSREAQSEAEAYFKRLARRFVVGHGLADPDARLRVGAVVDLANLGPLFSGKYYVSEVRHLFDGVRGARTEFVAERPGLGRV